MIKELLWKTRVGMTLIQLQNKSKINDNDFKYQDLDLSVYGRYVIGFKTKFTEYLEDIEVYTKKATDIQDFIR